MRGAATFLASPWGGGSDAARRPSALCCCYHTARYPGSMATLDHPWAGAALVWAGFACRARGDKEKAKR